MKRSLDVESTEAKRVRIEPVEEARIDPVIVEDESPRLECDDQVLAKAFYEVRGRKDLRITNDQPIMWSATTLLWEEVTENDVRNVLLTTIKDLAKAHLEEHQGLYQEFVTEHGDDQRKMDAAVKGRFKDVSANYKRLMRVLDYFRYYKNTKGAWNVLRYLCKADDFLPNKSPHELPLAHGLVLDLKKGETRPRVQTDLWTFECPVSYLDNEPIDKAEEFFTDVCVGVDKRTSLAYVEFLQKVLGYCMTGETSERFLFVIFGDGTNGKTVLLRVLEAILGPLFTPLDRKVLLETRSSSSHSAELIPLKFARIGSLSETEDDGKLNETQVKRLSGAEGSLSARDCGEKQIKFETAAKLILATNHLPQVSGDKAIMGRMLLLPFLQEFAETPENTEKTALLQTEYLSQMFTFIARGAKEWYAKGTLGEPPEVCQFEKLQYTREIDSMGLFLEQHVLDEKDYEKTHGQKMKPKDRPRKNELYAYYIEFCSTEHLTPVLGSKKFYQRLNKRFKSKYTSGVQRVCCSFSRSPIDRAALAES